jgi:imidazole glycerol phosphate synthase subunit HisF
MHGESTQALSGEQAVQTGSIQTPVTKASGAGEALVGSMSNEGTNKGLAA